MKGKIPPFYSSGNLIYNSLVSNYLLSDTPLKIGPAGMSIEAAREKKKAGGTLSDH